MKNEKAPRKLTEAQKAKIRDSIRERFPNGRPNARKGIRLSDETKQKMSDAKRGTERTAEQKEAQKIRMQKWWDERKAKQAGGIELSTQPAPEPEFITLEV